MIIEYCNTEEDFLAGVYTGEVEVDDSLTTQEINEALDAQFDNLFTWKLK
jgi:predicted metalloprotease